MTNYDAYRSDKILFYLEGIRNGTRQFPPSLQIAITDHCFNKCVMCGHWKRADKRSLPVADLTRFLSEAKRIGLETVCYSGGDPLFYLDINTVMRWHVANDVPFGFITSGLVLQFVDMGLLSKAAWVRVSLDSIDADVYDKLRGGVHLGRIMTSMEKMWLAGVNLQFGITLTDLNCAEIVPLAHYAISMGVSAFRVWPVRSHPELSPRPDKSKYYLGLADQLLSGIDNNCIDAIGIIDHGECEEFDNCKAVLFQLFIDASGDAYHCCILAGDACDRQLADSSFGNVFKDNLPDVYSRAFEFSYVPRANLPAGCTGCTKRLQSINVVAEKHWNDKHFL